MLDFIDEMLYNTCRSLVIDIFGSPVFDEVKKWLLIGDSSNPFHVVFKEGGIAQIIYDSLIPLAGVILIILFYISAIDKVTKELGTIQMISKLLIEFGVGALIILHGYTLVSNLAQIGDVVYGYVNEATTSSGNRERLLFIEKICSQYDLFYDASLIESNNYGDAEGDIPIGNLIKTYDQTDGNGIGTFGNVISLMFINVINSIISIFCVSAAISRLVQLAVYVSFSPIAIVQVIGEGMHSQGVRFFKRLMATSLTGAIMLMLCSLNTYIAASGSVMGFLAGSAAIAMAMNKADSFATNLVL